MTAGRESTGTATGPQRGSSCRCSKKWEPGRERKPTRQAQLCRHLQRRRGYALTSSVTSPPARARLEQPLASEPGALINDHRAQAVPVCERGWGRVFLNAKTPTSRGLNTGCMILGGRRKMCWFPLESDHLLQTGLLI